MVSQYQAFFLLLWVTWRHIYSSIVGFRVAEQGLLSKDNQIVASVKGSEQRGTFVKTMPFCTIVRGFLGGVKVSLTRIQDFQYSKVS